MIVPKDYSFLVVSQHFISFPKWGACFVNAEMFSKGDASRFAKVRIIFVLGNEVFSLIQLTVKDERFQGLNGGVWVNGQFIGQFQTAFIKTRWQNLLGGRLAGEQIPALSSGGGVVLQRGGSCA